MRQEGSGLSKGVTDAVEKMFAAQLRGDANEIQEQIRIIDRAKKAGLSYMTGKRVFGLIDQTCKYMSLEVLDAQANPRDRLGDVCIKLKDGSKLWVEVKAQTKKKRFRDITQADYVREGTDFARKFARSNPEFNRLIVGNLRIALALDADASSIKDWKLAELWVADLALLVDEEKRRRAGVESPADLPEFLRKKYLFHICMEGARIIRLDQLTSIKLILSGKRISTVLKTSNKSVAAIQISVGEEPTIGRTAFTYHFGFPNAPGRHKLHDFALVSSEQTKVFT